MPLRLKDLFPGKTELQLQGMHRIVSALTQVLNDGPTPVNDAEALTAIYVETVEVNGLTDSDWGVALRAALEGIIANPKKT